jgi:type I restriction enzyme M protein
MSNDVLEQEQVKRIRKLYNKLRKNGITSTQFITELSYLLFLKILHETNREYLLPEGHNWATLKRGIGDDLLIFYRQLLLNLGDLRKSKSSFVQIFFNNAQSSLTTAPNLRELLDAIDKINCASSEDGDNGLTQLYEELLQQSSSEKNTDAGQYITPRPLINSIVRLIKPNFGEEIHDPAAGSGGFLVAADQYIKERTDRLYSLTPEQANFQRNQAFKGMEIDATMHKLCLMNLMLYKINGNLGFGDTLTSIGKDLKDADLVLSNPPFGSNDGNTYPSRDDFTITFETNNRQFAFVEHIILSLKPGGRAAIVLPDNVLFEDNTGRKLREFMLNRCNLHTILRLPTGIFSSQGVKTNVVFLQRGHSERDNTTGVWIYDMRSNMRSFGKNNPLRLADFADFEAAYGSDPNGNSPRIDQGESGRFRYFSRDYIRERNDNLDITWLRDASADHDDQLQQPDQLAEAIVLHLRNALDQFDSLSAELNDPSLIQANV